MLTQGFDPRHSRINLLIVARSLGVDVLERVAGAIDGYHSDPEPE